MIVHTYRLIVERAAGTGYKASIQETNAAGYSTIAAGQANDETQAILLAAKQLAGEDTTPWHTPSDRQENCVLCGETVYLDRYDNWTDANTGNSVEVAEMHGQIKPLYGTQDIRVSSGFCHAQCGINAGWEVS